MPSAPRRAALVLVLASGFVNMLGTTLTVVALPLLTLGLGGGAGQLGLVGSAETAAGAIGIALSGPLVLRVGARRTAILACLGAASLVSVIPWLAAVHRLTVPWLAVIAAAAALAAAPGVTSRQDMLARGAETAQVAQDRSDALYWLLVRSGAAVGAPLASLLLTELGTADLIWCDALSFLASALLLAPGGPLTETAPVLLEVPAAPAGPGFGRQLGDGIRILTRSPALRTLTATALVLGAADGPRIPVLAPLYLRQGHLAADALGWILGSYTVGSLAGLAVYATIAGRTRLTLVLPVCLAGTALGYAILAAGRTELLGLAGMFAMGAAQGPFLPAMVTTVHTRCPLDTAPAALGSLLAITSTAVPVGTFLGALAVQAVPLPAVLAAIAALYAAAIVPVRTLAATAEPASPAPLADCGTVPNVEVHP